MKMKRLNIQLPAWVKTKLDAKRREGMTASGFIRSLLEREITQVPTGRKGKS